MNPLEQDRCQHTQPAAANIHRRAPEGEAGSGGGRRLLPGLELLPGSRLLPGPLSWSRHAEGPRGVVTSPRAGPPGSGGACAVAVRDGEPGGRSRQASAVRGPRRPRQRGQRGQRPAAVGHGAALPAPLPLRRGRSQPAAPLPRYGGPGRGRGRVAPALALTLLFVPQRAGSPGGCCWTCRPPPPRLPASGERRPRGKGGGPAGGRGSGAAVPAGGGCTHAWPGSAALGRPRRLGWSCTGANARAWAR